VLDADIVDGSAHMLQLLLATKKVGFVAGDCGQNIHDSSHFYATRRTRSARANVIRPRLCTWQQAVSGCHDLLDLRNLLWGKADASTSN
jgi:hypothetical protein